MYTVGYLSKIINIRPTNQTVDVVYEPVDSSNIFYFPIILYIIQTEAVLRLSLSAKRFMRASNSGRKCRMRP